jgi:hypothetical protein
MADTDETRRRYKSSINGQFRNCEAVAAEAVFRVVAKFRDEAMRGSQRETLFNHP